MYTCVHAGRGGKSPRSSKGGDGEEEYEEGSESSSEAESSSDEESEGETTSPKSKKKKGEPSIIHDVSRLMLSGAIVFQGIT